MRVDDDDDFGQPCRPSDLSPFPELIWYVVLMGAVAGLSMLLQRLGISIWKATEFAVLVWFVWVAVSDRTHPRAAKRWSLNLICKRLKIFLI